MKEGILAQAIEKLKNTKQEIIDKINSYEEEIRNYKNSNKELDDNLSVEVYNEKTEKWINSLKSCDTVKREILDLEAFIKEQKGVVSNVLNYNLNFGDLDHFFDMVLDIDGFDVQNFYAECSNISKATMIKFPFKASDIADFNKSRGFILVKADYMVKQRIHFGQANPNKLATAKEIIQMLKNSKIMKFHDTLIKYFSDNLKRVDSIAKENAEKIQEIRDSEISRRKEEVNNNIKEIERKIDECKKSLVSIGEAYDLYDKYKETGDKEVLLELTAKLADLVIISQRESKILKHEDKEKSEAKEETPVEEIKKEEVTTEVKTLDSDYFRRPDTVRIICFLGTEDDSIINDIENYFDKSIRHKVLERMDSIFNTLFQDKKHIARAGGDPDGTTSKKTLKLLDPPLDFTYRRYAEGGDKFRIHAIRRYSKLLQDFGYGEGNIVFFGAVGPNKSINEKRSTYNRLGRRAVEEIGSKGNITKLAPSFDYIEHITRGYIPISLLSENDIEKLKNHEFNKALPGNIEQTIDNNKYVLFESLDSTSKASVKKWLDDYFIEQTNKLFEIKDMYMKLKGTTLD